MKMTRQDGIAVLVIGIVLAAVGGWLVVRYGAPDPTSDESPSLLGAVGVVLAGQGIFVAGRETRRLFQPGIVADIEAEEAERAQRRKLPVRVRQVVVGWVLTLPFVGFFVFYLSDDSGEHGERPLPLTLTIGGIMLAVIGFAAWNTLAWQRRKQGPGSSTPASVG